MSYMFYHCNSITSLDLSNFIIKNFAKIEYMLYFCYSLKYVDISSFIISQSTINLFSGLPDYCTIIMNKKSGNKIYTIPKTCEIIYLDD